MKQQVKEAQKKTIRTVLSVWLDGYPDDLKEAPHFPSLHTLLAFVQHNMADSDVVERVKRRLDSFLRDDDSPTYISVDDIDIGLSNLRLFNLVTPNCCQSLTWPVSFDSIPEKTFAEQLTYMDAELFRRVVPHQCMGCVWTGRDKKRLEAPSVYATVNQFNAVSYRLIAIILKWPDLPHSQRARIIDKWINIAQELRMLKNFSALKAIISGLQSNPVYRLSRVWAEVQREKMDLFNELADIFSERHNYTMCRELLMMEGTAKFADPHSTNTIRGMKGLAKKKNAPWSTVGRKKLDFQMSMAVCGTIPYLGTFLTDLTMVDTAMDDRVEGGLINFDKRRKEFEILAQIKLLQSSAQLYDLKADTAFIEWFFHIRTYDDKESYELSCEIEPVTPSTPQEVKGHRKKSSLGFFSPRRPLLPMVSSTSGSSISTSLGGSTPCICPDTLSVNSVFPSPEPQSPPTAARPPLHHSRSVSNLPSTDSSSSLTWASLSSPDFHVVKVVFDTTENHHGNMYKSIMVNNSDHTKIVTQKILSKFGVEGKPEDFVIFQILPDKELEIPDRGNVFYAVDTSVEEIQFVVKNKSDLERLRMKHMKGKGRRKKYTL
ncbi:hypothetical protein NP493_189g05005 [Ridgeia piscesae]|uniref:Ral guanine nucleotide dissociation stimulator-like 1 n=1 Tax=Ridgeia piscesae TaxID=27915 RepID=A0AAD9UES1_RIDPI|nr:hypothetical protein NP493_189g05005 [Ridgeia piscesae]